MTDIPEGLWQRDIAYLEFMIKLGNKMIHWLNSKDPMFQQEEYRPLVGPTKDRLTDEVRQMTIVCRQKKIQRQQTRDDFIRAVEQYSGLEWDDDGWDTAVKEYISSQEQQIGLKPGRLEARKL